MKKMMKLTALMLIFACFSQSVLAQEGAKKYENPEWKQIVYIKFEAGKYDEAMKIVNDYYMKASDKAGVPGPEMALEMRSGKWDMMIIWNMEGGISDMNWEVSPNNIKWKKALNEIAGGEEETKEIMKNYIDMVKDSYSEIARVRN
ncbi:MAG: hypothetical protein ACJAT1_000655 [Marivirga sp.]|jgi:hypothetical protein